MSPEVIIAKVIVIVKLKEFGKIKNNFFATSFLKTLNPEFISDTFLLAIQDTHFLKNHLGIDLIFRI